MAEFTINDLGKALNDLNSSSIAMMVKLAQAAGGTLEVANDTVVRIEDINGANGAPDGVVGNRGDRVRIGGIDIGNITTNENGHIGVDVKAGALVELQFKIDQMMASVQEGIKNSGKVSQTREGAARA